MSMRVVNLKSEHEDLWDRFTRREEYYPYIHDMHDRFPFWASKDREIFRPSVSEYLYQHGVIRPEYPGKSEFALCVTHDIDIVYSSPYLKTLNGLIALYQGNRQGAIQELSHVWNRKKPFYNFNEILSLEKQYGVKSTWFFQALEPGEPEYRYLLQDVANVFGEILDAGGEIALHGGFDAPFNLEQLLLEKSRLEQVIGEKVIGYRSHYLKFSVPETWERLAQAGFLFDSTLGYTDCAGFRSGMCHPYRPFNLNTGREIDIIELPLHVMDMNLFQHYMRLDIQRGWELIRRMIDAVYDCQGVFVVNWHNTGCLQGSDERKIFEKILVYCNEKGAWMEKAGDMI